MAGPELAAAAVAPELLGTVGAGLLAGVGGGTAGLFGAAPGLAATMLPAAEAAAPMMGMGGGTASLFGAAGASPLATSMAGLAPQAAGMGMDPKMMMRGASQLMGPQQQQQPAPAQRPPQGPPPQSNAEILERMKRMQGQRSNFAGLLGQAIGGY